MKRLFNRIDGTRKNSIKDLMFKMKGLPIPDRKNKSKYHKFQNNLFNKYQKHLKSFL